MRSRHWGGWLLAAAVAALAGCAQLADIDRDTCGNGIVDPNEDCDTFPKADTASTTPGKQCGAVGTSQQCRFVCDPTNTNVLCPSGWSCGSDKICRQPSATFASPRHPYSEPLLRVYSGDFDGDDQLDAVALGGAELHAMYFDPSDPFGYVQTLRPASVPSSGAMTSSGMDDLVLLAQGGINVMRGTADRSFLPTAYSSMAIPDSAGVPMKFVAMDAMWPNDMSDYLAYSGDEMLLFLGNAVIVPRNFTATGQEEGLAGGLPGTVDGILGDIQVANLWPDPVESPCEEFAFAYTATKQVHVVTPCMRGPMGYKWNSGLQLKLPPVSLPDTSMGNIGKGVIAADLNGDKRVDLLVDDDGYNLYAAFSTGDGHFHSNPEQLNDVGLVPDQRFGLVKVMVGDAEYPVGLPLAVADVNHDGVADMVMRDWSSTVLVSMNSTTPGTWSYYPSYVQQATMNVWTRAVIKDFNGNGAPDILTMSGNRPDFDFLNGTGAGEFNYFTVRTEGVPTDFRVGDFDGDLITDVVFVERLPGGGDNLAVAFGQSFGAPGTPVSIGRLGTVDSILPMDMTAFGLDATTDMLVITSTKDKDNKDVKSVAIFGGSSDRQLQSPLRLSQGDKDVTAVTVVLGQFDGDPAGHLDIAAIGMPMNNQGDPTVQGYSAWLVPSTAEAQIDSTQAAPSAELPSEFSIGDGLLAAVELDSAAGDDELVMFAPYWDPNSTDPYPTKQGAIAIARSVPQDKLRVFQLQGALMPTRLAWHSPQYGGMYGGLGQNGGKGGEPSPVAPGSEDMIGNPGGQIRVVDIDGDKLKDVALTGNFVDYQSMDYAETREIAIYRNTGTGSLDAANPLAISTSKIPGFKATEVIQGFTFMQADTDPELELVVLTRRETWLLDLDLKTNQIVQARLLEGVKGGFDAVAWDYDKDGIEDLVIVGEGGLFYHQGLAVRP